MAFIPLSASPAPLGRMLDEIRQQAGDADPALVLYFASWRLDGPAVARGMAGLFPHARTVGCSSRNEYVAGTGFTDGGLAAMLFERTELPEVAVALLSGLPFDIARKVETGCRALNAAMADEGALFRPDRYVGLALSDGVAGTEEEIMDRLGDLSTVEFVGGSASDDFSFDRTWVAVDGGAYGGATVLLLLRPGVPWAVCKTQSWQVWDGPGLVPTRVDLAKRRVYEFDGQPAVDRYAELLGFTRDNIDFPYCSQNHTLGLLANNELFVRHPARVNADGSMDFFCRLRPGQSLAMLTSMPVLHDTGASLDALRERLGGQVGGVIDFCCTQRYTTLKSNRELGAYATLNPEMPRVGFSTYGEQFIGHINCTSTLIAFAAESAP